MEKEPVILVPVRELVDSLNVGDKALDAFGNWNRVVSITFRGRSIDTESTKGHSYVGFYTESGPTAKISQSYVEGDIVRTYALVKEYTSKELDKMERQINQGRQLGQVVHKNK